jgi:hypothetical protein
MQIFMQIFFCAVLTFLVFQDEKPAGSLKVPENIFTFGVIFDIHDGR